MLQKRGQLSEEHSGGGPLKLETMGRETVGNLEGRR